MTNAIDRLLANNAAYAQGFDKGQLPSAPATRVAIVACMDARLRLGAMLGLDEGDAHVIRNAGGVVTEDVIRSLVASQSLLGTREIMVIQHTRCGMQAEDESEVLDAIEEATGRRPDFALGTFPDLEESVRRSLARLRATPLLIHTDVVRGFVYDVDTGRLREVR